MPDYQEMYYIMCDAGSKALDALPNDVEAAIEVLQRALDEAEDLYIETCEDTEQKKPSLCAEGWPEGPGGL